MIISHFKMFQSNSYSIHCDNRWNNCVFLKDKNVLILNLVECEDRTKLIIGKN